MLRASAPQAEGESSAAVGRTSCQQELCAQSVATVFSVSSAKQCNQGNAWHVLCVSVMLTGMPIGHAGSIPDIPQTDVPRSALWHVTMTSHFYHSSYCEVSDGCGKDRKHCQFPSLIK